MAALKQRDWLMIGGAVLVVLLVWWWWRRSQGKKLWACGYGYRKQYAGQPMNIDYPERRIQKQQSPPY